VEKAAASPPRSCDSLLAREGEERAAGLKAGDLSTPRVSTKITLEPKRRCMRKGKVNLERKRKKKKKTIGERSERNPRRLKQKKGRIGFYINDTRIKSSCGSGLNIGGGSPQVWDGGRQYRSN